MLENSFFVKYITSRNCFLVLSEANTKKLSYQKIVKLSYDSKELYCSCIISNEITDNSYVGIPSLYAKSLGIVEHESVYISDILRLPTLSKIMISPSSADDYEILELSSETVQSTLLDQIRVVNKDQKLTIWISKWLHVSVKIDDAEPMAFGCLANLTEVHIAQPPKLIENNKKSLEIPTTPENTQNNHTDTENTEITEKPENQDCAELRRLKRYLTIKKPVVFRVCPLITPLTLTKNDKILTHPFNVFMFKSDVPKFLLSNSQKGIILCKVGKIDPPTDYRDNKEENTNIIKNDLIVRVCIVEDFYESFSDDIKSYFEVISDKFPTIYVPEKTMGLFDLFVGSKLMVGNSFDFQSEVRSVELIPTDKKVKNIVQKFKSYLAEQVKYTKCVLNSEIPIEIEEKVYCLVKFYPPSEFCLFDEFVLRNSKIYENTDKHVDLQKNEININLINTSEICIDVCDFKNIVKQGEMLLSMKSRNENVLITGKSGSGKTSIAKYIAQNLSQKPHFMHVIVIPCKKLKGKSVESLHKYFAQDFQNMIYFQPALLVLDDLHIICGKNESGSEVQTQEGLYYNRIGEMLSELIETNQKSNKITIIATAESTLKLNENILSSRGKHLFRNIFKISELNKKDRETILRNIFQQRGIVDNEIDYEDLSVRTEGYVIQDLVDFANKAIFESCKRNVSQVEDSKPVTVTAFDIDSAFSNSVALALRDVRLHSPGEKDFKDVGGLEPVKEILIEAMNWPSQYPELFSAAPLRLQSGILLYGPPGVGKTLIVGAAAKQCGLRLIAIKGPELLSKYIGASEQGVRNIFEKAQSARPCILFFDEFDSLAPRRGHDSTGVTDRVVNQLLTQLDGVESLTGVFVVAATSRPDLLDPALLRPGRLDKQILCPVPDEKGWSPYLSGINWNQMTYFCRLTLVGLGANDRLSIIKALSRNLNFVKDVELNKVAVQTQGFSGADLQAILYTAQLYAVEDALRAGKDIDTEGVLITNQHLEDSLKGTGASLTKQEAAKYEKIYAKFQNKKEEIDSTIKKQKATLA